VAAGSLVGELRGRNASFFFFGTAPASLKIFMGEFWDREFSKLMI
jgi:hypothetical protein